MAQQGFDNGRPGDPALRDYRGKEAPVARPGEAPDNLLTPPVGEDDASRGEHVETGSEEPRRAPSEPVREAPETPAVVRKPPGDEQRARMMDRMAERRREREELEETEAGTARAAAGEGDDGAAAAAAAAAGEPGAAAGDDARPDAEEDDIILAVRGKTVRKSKAEVAALSGMSEDEVAERPDLAKRFAQLALVAHENYEESKIVRRDTPSSGPAGTRPAAASEEDGETGRDVGERPSTPGKTTREEAKKLLDDIQIGDSEDVAPKLIDFITQTADAIVERRMNESEGSRAVGQENASNLKAWGEFLTGHPELKGKSNIAAALSHQLDQEFRTDLHAILVTEGLSEEDARATLQEAERAHGIDAIRTAHRKRRLDGNPRARPITKELAEKVYAKVREDFGIPDPAGSSSQRPPSREARKQTLQPQPRRASPAPAAPAPTAQTQLQSRRAVAAEMASRTGRKRHSAG